MTTRTSRTVKLGVRPGNASDVETFQVQGATDEIAAVHETYPVGGLISTSVAGSRVHLLGFADTEEGIAPSPLIPAVAAGGQELPEVAAEVNAQGTATYAAYTNNTTFGAAALDETVSTLLRFDLDLNTSPSGLLWEVGSTNDGAYVGFVNGELVVRNQSGADLRVPWEQYVGESGKLMVFFDVTDGSVKAFWGKDDQNRYKYLGESATGVAADWFSGSGNGAVYRAASGTANIEGGTGPAPTTASDNETKTYSSSFTATMPSHTAGDMLIACVAMHPYGGDNLADATVSGWQQILDHDGASGSYAPTMQVFTKIATSSNEKCQVSCSGPTKNWEKTVTIMEIDNCKRVTATLGDVQNGGQSTIGFPAAVGSPGLVLHGLTASVSKSLQTPSGEALVENSDPYPRGQRWSETTNGAAKTGHPIDTYPAHTSLTLNCFGEDAGEGAGAPSGFDLNFCCSWNGVTFPGSLYDEGYAGDDGTPAIPATDAIGYLPGAQSTAYSELSSGYSLESASIRLSQTRSGAGLWTARLFALSDEGEYFYAQPLRAPFDTSSSGEVGDRYMLPQTAFIDGTSVNSALSQGWALGVQIESLSEDSNSAFGTANLDVAEIELSWIVPPQVTLLYPLAGTDLPTVTPQVGWVIGSGDTQSAYRVRVWESSSYDSSDTDAGRIAYDSGTIFSGSTRAHQVTRPLRPLTSYLIGVQVEGEAIGGRAVEALWQVAEVTTPDSPFGDDLSEIDSVSVEDVGDGSAKVSAAVVSGSAGDWAMIERARTADLDAAIEDSEEDWLGLENRFMSARGWFQDVDLTTSDTAPTKANSIVEFEWRGRINNRGFTTSTQYLFSYGYTTISPREGGMALQLTGSGLLQLQFSGTSGYLGFNASASLFKLNESEEFDDIWLKAVVDSTTDTDNGRFYKTSDGENWELVNTQTLVQNTGPDTFLTTNPASIVIGSYRNASSANFTLGSTSVTRKVGVSLETDGDLEVLVDLDVDRDGADGADSITDPATGRVFAPTTFNGMWLKRFGAFPAESKRRISAVGTRKDLDLEGGIILEGVPSKMEGNVYQSMACEVWGTIPQPDWSTVGSYVHLWALKKANSVKGIWMDIANADNIRIYMHNGDSGGYFVWISPSVMTDFYGRYVGFRCDWRDDEGYCNFSVSLDHGETWQFILRDDAMTRAADLPHGVEDVDDTYNFRVTGSANHYLSDQMQIDRVYLTSLSLGRDLLDLDISESEPDLTASQFVDTEGNTWKVGEDVGLVEAAATRKVPASQVDDLWLPVSSLREIPVGGVKADGSPRVEFVDHGVPLHEEVSYRVRLIDEPEPTFEATSSFWAESVPATIESPTWWLSSLDGVTRFPLQPTAFNSSRSRPGEVGSGLGSDKNVLVRDVLKDPFDSLSLVVHSQFELDELESLVDPGDHLFLQDSHGRSAIVQPVGTVTKTPIRTMARPGDTAPVGRTYRVDVDLVEVRDPRDFGYGSNLVNL